MQEAKSRKEASGYGQLATNLTILKFLYVGLEQKNQVGFRMEFFGIVTMKIVHSAHEHCLLYSLLVPKTLKGLCL